MRITVQMVKDAYIKADAKPTRESYRTGDGTCGCALGALAAAHAGKTLLSSKSSGI